MLTHLSELADQEGGCAASVITGAPDEVVISMVREDCKEKHKGMLPSKSVKSQTEADV